MRQEKQEELWVFGYGSLIWRPGFDYLERGIAQLHGFHRSLCVYSHSHRGTIERPGLVLGLERGGSCYGMAYRICESKRVETLKYLQEREQISFVYIEKYQGVKLQDGRKVMALTYVVDPKHPQYTGKLTLEQQLLFVRQGEGKSGKNPDYVINTVKALAELGVKDLRLQALAKKLNPAD
jgi:glutathione-specific gamma-glutamylcyclotransferase